MTCREAALRGLDVGDVFHGEGSNGASLICLVTAVTEDTIRARTVTTHYDLEFDRRTGTCEWGNGTDVIDSVVVLPGDIRAVILSFVQLSVPLTDTQRQALLFVDHFYKENPL